MPDAKQTDWVTITTTGLDDRVVRLQLPREIVDTLRAWGFFPTPERPLSHLSLTFQYIEYHQRYRPEKLQGDLMAAKILIAAFDRPIVNECRADALAGLPERFRLLMKSIFDVICQWDCPASEWVSKMLEEWRIYEYRAEIKRWIKEKRDLAYLADADDFFHAIIDRLLSGSYQTLPRSKNTAKGWFHNKVKDETKSLIDSLKRRRLIMFLSMVSGDAPSASRPEVIAQSIPEETQVTAHEKTLQWIDGLPPELKEVVDAAEQLRIVVGVSGKIRERYPSPIDGELRESYREELANALSIASPELGARLKRLQVQFEIFVKRMRIELELGGDDER